MKFKILAPALCILTVLSCNEKKTKNESLSQVDQPVDVTTKRTEPDSAEVLVLESILAHGGNLYNTAHYGFTFRDKNYTFNNEGKNYIYTATQTDDSDTIIDFLENGKLLRTRNGEPEQLSEEDIQIHTEALNSVIYFATLPHKLSDNAVNKEYIENTVIKGKEYSAVKITFDRQGGGNDHDDIFMYWINTDTKTVDYLAYSYHVKEGGVRFRSAYNPRIVDGVLFQDYINYKAPLGTPLTELPKMFENSELEELSKIETENIHNLNKK